MIERLLEQRWPLTAVLSDSSVTKQSNRYLDPKTEQWNLLDALNTLHAEIISTSPFINAEIKIISRRSK